MTVQVQGQAGTQGDLAATRHLRLVENPSRHPAEIDCVFCVILYIPFMQHPISATDLARRLGDILGRIRYRGDVFTVEKNGTPVASIGPVPGAAVVTLRDAAGAWIGADTRDDFAEDLERVNAADRPPGNPWAS